MHGKKTRVLSAGSTQPQPSLQLLTFLSLSLSLFLPPPPSPPLSPPITQTTNENDEMDLEAFMQVIADAKLAGASILQNLHNQPTNLRLPHHP